MRVLAHLSDLHFGRTDAALLEPLIAAVRELRPHLVAISGDLTQRATDREFEQARRFLDALPQPRLVVPGNHDVPLYNVLARFQSPLERYRRWITADLGPVYEDDEMIVAGINTARSLTFKGGRVGVRQVETLYERLCELDGRVLKIVVTHHPFELPEGFGAEWLVGRAAMAMRRLAACGADLILSGHLHLAFTGHTAARYRIAGHSALVVQAGTASSTRGRGELNSFNVVRVEKPAAVVERHEWRGGAFVPARSERFRHTEEGWMPESGW